MSLFQRAHDIVAAKANKALDSAENPNEMLDYSYQQMLDQITRVRRGAGRHRRFAQADRAAGAAAAAHRRPPERPGAGRARAGPGGPGQGGAVAQGRRPAADRRDGSAAPGADRAGAEARADPRPAAGAGQQLPLAEGSPEGAVHRGPGERRGQRAGGRASPADFDDTGEALARAQDKIATMQARAGALDELMQSGVLEDVGGDTDDIQEELDQAGHGRRRGQGAGRDEERELALPAAGGSADSSAASAGTTPAKTDRIGPRPGPDPALPRRPGGGDACHHDSRSSRHRRPGIVPAAPAVGRHLQPRHRRATSPAWSTAPGPAATWSSGCCTPSRAPATAFDPASGHVRLPGRRWSRAPGEPHAHQDLAQRVHHDQPAAAAHPAGHHASWSICGIRTEQCCETTARVASDLGYQVTFVTEATATNPIAHRDAPRRPRPSTSCWPTRARCPPSAIIERTEYALAGRFATIATDRRG